MYKKILFVFLLVIFSLKFYDGVFAREGILKNASFGFMLLAILMSVPYVFKYKGGFVLGVQLISGSILLSIFMAQYTWHQGLEYSSTTIPYLIWFAYFFLLRSNIPIRAIENIVMIYGIVYIVLFLYQFTHSGTVLFGTHDEFIEDRGIVRVNFPGTGVFFLSCFIAINKMTNNAKYKYLWLSFALIGIVIIVLQVTRQLIFFLLFFYLLHFMKNVRLPYKIATVVFFVIAGYAFVNSENPISKGLASQQKEDASHGKKYIRIIEAEYYLTRFTPNTASKIFGNGLYNYKSKYGRVIDGLEHNEWYFLSDVGVVEVYVLFGVFAILGYIIIFVQSFRISLPPDHQYLKYYLWVVMCTSFTSDSLISYNFLITTVLVLYCYQRLYEYQKVLEQTGQQAMYGPGGDLMLLTDRSLKLSLI